MHYRRAYIPGGSYFFTVVTAYRRALFSDEANVTVLREALRKILQKRPF
jgi:putative transposase